MLAFRDQSTTLPNNSLTDPGAHKYIKLYNFCMKCEEESHIGTNAFLALWYCINCLNQRCKLLMIIPESELQYSWHLTKAQIWCLWRTFRLLTRLLNLFKPKIRPWLGASQHECSNYEMVKSEAMCAPFNIYQLLDACQYLFVPWLLVYSWHE